MSEKTYSIGELSKLSGISVRRIRFYSDKNLLPPTDRTFSGYRLYSDADLARLDLIRALREAGVGLQNIRKMLSQQLSLTDVLKLRLESLQAEIVSQRRIASVLRMTLQNPQPTGADLQRLWTMVSLSKHQSRQLIEHFFEQAVGDVPIEEQWKRRMIEAGTPDLPENPTARQIDAWSELVEMLSDKDYIANMRAETADMWNEDFNPSAYAKACDETLAEVRTALAENVEPVSETGISIARRWLESSAKAMKRHPDETFLHWQLEQYRKHHARSARYQELPAILRDDDSKDAPGREWQWIHEAMVPLLAKES